MLKQKFKECIRLNMQMATIKKKKKKKRCLRVVQQTMILSTSMYVEVYTSKERRKE
jgi:hypothetical protein